jgi:peptidoglycan-associated lipoprotein
MMERALSRTGLFVALLFSAAVIACGDNPKPVARPAPPPPADAAVAARKPPSPPQPVAEPTIVPAEPVPDDSVASASLVDLNKNSPLKPVFFDYDSAEVNTAAQATLNENAALLKKYSGWTITIEGHCDERGSAEYNLALGERRSVAARAYLVAIGISAERLRTVSYGKEFPFEPGHDEGAWQKNRRAHFVITGR